jgi:DNA-binding MarR family transcriptional regulator
MSKPKRAAASEITQTPRGCLCLHLQRAARAVARRFDDAFRPIGITSGQFSMMMALSQMEAPTIGRIADVLAMDRTTLTANLKPLARRAFVKVSVDPKDKRSRLLSLTPSGRAILAEAVPVWRLTHAAIERVLGRASPERLRVDLRALS